MKIRNPKLVAAAGWLVGQTARLMMKTVRFQQRTLGANVTYGRLQQPDRFIYSIWHENLLLPTIQYGGPDLAVLISQHADGQLLGGLIQQMQMELILGSSTRGGVEAVRQLLRDDPRWRNVAITPDGPRGPRRIVQAGMIYVASRTGMKIVPIGVGYQQAWHLKSWDRFAIPKPTTRATCLAGIPIAIPPKLRSDQLEPYRQLVQTQMDRVNAAAEEWARTNHCPAVDSATVTSAARSAA